MSLKGMNEYLDYKNMMKYETYMVVGFLIAILSLLNVIGLTKINSDFFWALAGIGLIVQGFLERQKWKKTHDSNLKKDKMKFKF